MTAKLSKRQQAELEAEAVRKLADAKLRYQVRRGTRPSGAKCYIVVDTKARTNVAIHNDHLDAWFDRNGRNGREAAEQKRKRR